MKKNGFTLIELLAVIVILAIIVVIAFPKILDVIESSKEKANKSSVELVKSSIKTQLVASNLSDSKFVSDSNDCYLFDFDNQDEGNASILDIKNKDKIGGSIKYCYNTSNFEDNNLTIDGVLAKGDTNEPVIKKLDMINELANNNYVTHNLQVTKNDEVYTFHSPYGENGWINFNADLSKRKYTRLFIRGKRINQQPNFLHTMVFVTTTDNNDPSIPTQYPPYNTEFTFDVDLKDYNPSWLQFHYCYGDIEIYEMYFEYE